jgi:hypothetical protein
MRSLLLRLFAAVVVISGFSFVHADDEGAKSGGGLQPGTKSKPTHIPGSFQLWMVTGPQAGRYHSPVCEHGLNPVAFIFLRDLDLEDKGLVSFLKKLDELSVKHPDARFGVCAVVLNDGGFRAALETDEGDFAKALAKTAAVKEDYEKKMKELATQEKLERAAFALYAEGGPKGFNLGKDAATTVIFYNKHVVLDNFTFQDKLKDEDVAKMMGEIEQVVLETERLARPSYKNKLKATKKK